MIRRIAQLDIRYKLSLVCGLLPLLLGCLIFLGWCITRADWLETAGIYNICAGCVLFVCGIACLVFYGLKVRKDGNGFPLKSSLVSLGILLSNFPVASLILGAAIAIQGTSVATIENKSSYDVIDFVLVESGGIENGELHPFPGIVAGRKVTRKIRFKYDGAVNYRLSLNGTAKEGIMFGYVMRHHGAVSTLVIQSDGKIETVK